MPTTKQPIEAIDIHVFLNNHRSAQDYSGEAKDGPHCQRRPPSTTYCNKDLINMSLERRVPRLDQDPENG
jgi:hypothetical protein